MDKLPTLTSGKIRKYIDQQVKVFLENGVALDGVLLDYVYDPVERTGVLVLTSNRGSEPTLVFRQHVTTIQPVAEKKG